MPVGDPFGFGLPGFGPHGGGPQNQPFERLEKQADPNRGIVRNVSPLLIPPTGLGVGASTFQGPWAQNVESTDYTLYVTREWSGPQAPGALLRESSMRIEVGAGSGLSRELLLPHLSPVGFAYHIAAQTIKATFEVVATLPGQLFYQNDQVSAWIARGRPSVNINQTFPPSTNAIQRIPSFARWVTLSEQFVGTWTPATATVTWYDVDGLAISTNGLGLLAGSQRMRVYALASGFSVQDVNPALLAVAQWECIA